MKSRNIDKLHAQIATSVKQRIRILRENNNYSQREIAEYLGIDRSTYACYELGKTSPSVEVLVALSELYLVSCEFLLGIKPNEKCNSRVVISSPATFSQSNRLMASFTAPCMVEK